MINEEIMKGLVNKGNNDKYDTARIAHAIVSVSSFALFGICMLFVPVVGPMMLLPAIGLLARCALPSEELNKWVNSKNFLIRVFSRAVLASTVIGAVLFAKELSTNEDIDMKKMEKFVNLLLKGGTEKGKSNKKHVNSNNKQKESIKQSKEVAKNNDGIAVGASTDEVAKKAKNQHGEIPVKADSASKLVQSKEVTEKTPLSVRRKPQPKSFRKRVVGLGDGKTPNCVRVNG